MGLWELYFGTRFSCRLPHGFITCGIVIINTVELHWLIGGGRVVRWCWVELPVPGRPTIWMVVGQGPIALAVEASGGGLDIFNLLSPVSHLSSSLWETARYRLKYCLKGPLNQNQKNPKKQPTSLAHLPRLFRTRFLSHLEQNPLDADVG